VKWVISAGGQAVYNAAFKNKVATLLFNHSPHCSIQADPQSHRQSFYEYFIKALITSAIKTLP